MECYCFLLSFNCSHYEKENLSKDFNLDVGLYGDFYGV